MFNTTTVEDGTRAVFSSVQFSPSGGVDIFDAIGGPSWSLLRLSTAVHASARFPYVSPSGSIYPYEGALQAPEVSKPFRHLVDGGYFENSGADTALDIVQAIRRVDPTTTIKLVLIGNDPDSINLCPRVDIDTGMLFDAAPKPIPLGELTAPPRAFIETREARGRLAQVRAITAVSGCAFAYEWRMSVAEENAELEREFAALTGNCEESGSPPLGWALSPASTCFMLSRITSVLESAKDMVPFDRSLQTVDDDLFRDVFEESALQGEAIEQVIAKEGAAKAQ